MGVSQPRSSKPPLAYFRTHFNQRRCPNKVSFYVNPVTAHLDYLMNGDPAIPLALYTAWLIGTLTRLKVLARAPRRHPTDLDKPTRLLGWTRDVFGVVVIEQSQSTFFSAIPFEPRQDTFQFQTINRRHPRRPIFPTFYWKVGLFLICIDLIGY